MNLNELQNDNGPKALFDSQNISRAQATAIPALIEFAITLQEARSRNMLYTTFDKAIEKLLKAIQPLQ